VSAIKVRERIIHTAPMMRSGPDVPSSAAKEAAMAHHVYKHLVLTGSSPASLQDAIETAIARASQTVRHMDWFEVIETRGAIQDGKIAHWQVTLNVGFRLE
jgi:hypothetical protein